MNNIRILAIIFGVLCLFSQAHAISGLGTEIDPWLITSLTDFNDFTADPNYFSGYTRLDCDLDLSGLSYTRAPIAPDTNIAASFQGVKFTGVFNGNGSNITNLTVDTQGAYNSYLGLFGYIDSDAVIKNLKLEQSSINGSTDFSYGDTSVGSYYTGGLAGNNKGTIFGCSFTGSVESSGKTGGLIGQNDGAVSNCFAQADVSGCDALGGLIGYNSNCNILKCYFSGQVNLNNEMSSAGGLIGQNNSGDITDCYSQSDVNGLGHNYTFIGGLIGNSASTDISNCYCVSDVSGLYRVGGMLGRMYSSSISNSFWDIDVQTHDVNQDIGFIQGTGNTITNVAGLSTALMQTESTYTSAGWDLTEIWTIDDGSDYPMFMPEGGGWTVCPQFLSGFQAGIIDSSYITETSGISPSRRNKQVLWIHNDSGDSARIYAINTSGDYLGRYPVSGAYAQDWEDIATGPGPADNVNYIYCGDIGDNSAGRSYITIYRIPEPHVDSDQSPVNQTLFGAASIRLQYPDGARDAETLMVDPRNKDIYIISKRENFSRLYRAPYPQSTTQTTTMEFLGQLPWGWAVGGDISPTGNFIIVKNSNNASLWKVTEDGSIADAFAGTECPIPLLSEYQGEAIGFNGNGCGYFTISEGTDQPLYYFPRDIEPVTGDIDCDCDVDMKDYTIFAFEYGTSPAESDADLNGDGFVDIYDLAILSNDWLIGTGY